jgi:hypothetical protein
MMPGKNDHDLTDEARGWRISAKTASTATLTEWRPTDWRTSVPLASGVQSAS